MTIRSRSGSGYTTRRAPPVPALLPAVGVLREAGTLDPHDAEALPRGRLHHDPALQALGHRSAQLLQTRHLGRDVVGLDVEMDAALMLHALDLHDGLVGRRLQHAVVAAAAGMPEVHRPPQRRAPEAGGRGHIAGLTVDQHGAEAGMMHGEDLSYGLLNAKQRAQNAVERKSLSGTRK